MSDKNRLLDILSNPVYCDDPLMSALGYLLENDVIPVVRCRDVSSGMRKLGGATYTRISLTAMVRLVILTKVAIGRCLTKTTFARMGSQRMKAVTSALMWKLIPCIR